MDAESSACDFVGPEKEEKLIVFKSCLFQLLDTCSCCNGSCSVTESNIMGTYRTFNIDCSRCGKVRTWSTQPIVCDIPAGNLALSAAITFSGASPSKFLRALKMMNIPAICYRTYLNHNKLYIHPTVFSFWKDHQHHLVNTLVQMNGELELAGDARSDSPGHSAKFTSYSMLESRINKVLDIQLIQVDFTDVENANALILYSII